MTECAACGEHSKANTVKDFTKAVIEIDNPETLILFHKVVIPASMGDENDVPATIGKYYNVLLVYEVNNHAYLYSSDGVPTLLSSEDVQELEDRVNIIEEELTNKQNKLTAGNNITIDENNVISSSGGDYTAGTGLLLNDEEFSIDSNIVALKTDIPTKTSELTNDGADNTSTYVEADELAAVATSGSYTDLVDQPTIDTTLSTSSSNAIANSAISNTLNQDLVTGLSLDATLSPTTVQLNETKKNLYSGATSSQHITLPVASSTQAGVMNSSAYSAIISNTNMINALVGGAVAITGLSASPSQAELTAAWQNETGLTTLINRASIYDVTNQKVWTYYANDTTWYAAANTSQVTVNTFTNSSEGTILGSTNNGQIFAENDGTGSVNGWDTLTGNVSTNTSNITSLQTSVAGKQDALTAGSNVSISAQNVISATDTTYSAGTGLNLTGTAFSVDTSTIATKSDIPTVNDATLTIQNNGSNVATFTANSATNTTANIVSPVDIGSVLSTPTDVAYVNTNNIANTAITTPKIADGAVTADKIDFSTFDRNSTASNGYYKMGDLLFCWGYATITVPAAAYSETWHTFTFAKRFASTPIVMASTGDMPGYIGEYSAANNPSVTGVEIALGHVAATSGQVSGRLNYLAVGIAEAE